MTGSFNSVFSRHSIFKTIFITAFCLLILNLTYYSQALPATVPFAGPTPTPEAKNQPVPADQTAAPRRKSRFEMGAEAARSGRIFVNDLKTVQSGCSLLEQGKYDEAISDLTEVIAREPEAVNAYVCRGQAFAFAKRMVDAWKDTETVFTLVPESSGGFIMRGHIYAQQEKYEEAAADFTKAIEKNDPNKVPGLLNRAVARLKLEKWREALADYDLAITLDPKNEETYIERAKIYIDYKADYQAAVNDTTTAFQINPRYGIALLFRGFAYKRLENWKAAEADYTRAFGLGAGTANSYVNRGEIYEKLGQTNAAIADYQKALKLDPNHANAKTNLAAALTKQLPVKQ